MTMQNHLTRYGLRRDIRDREGRECGPKPWNGSKSARDASIREVLFMCSIGIFDKVGPLRQWTRRILVRINRYAPSRTNRRLLYPLFWIPYGIMFVCLWIRNLFKNLNALGNTMAEYYVPFNDDFAEMLEVSCEEQDPSTNRYQPHPWQGTLFEMPNGDSFPMGQWDFTPGDPKRHGLAMSGMLSGGETCPYWYEKDRYNGIDYDDEEAQAKWEEENPHKYENDYNYDGKLATRRYVEDVLIRFLHTRLNNLEGGSSACGPRNMKREFHDLIWSRAPYKRDKEIAELTARIESLEKGEVPDEKD